MKQTHRSYLWSAVSSVREAAAGYSIWAMREAIRWCARGLQSELQNTYTRKQPYFREWALSVGKRRGSSGIRAPTCCAARREAETLQRTAAGDEESNASYADCGSQAGNLAICSVTATWEQKSHPARSCELQRARCVQEQLEEASASHCLAVWPALASAQPQFICWERGLKKLDWEDAHDIEIHWLSNYELWNEFQSGFFFFLNHTCRHKTITFHKGACVGREIFCQTCHLFGFFLLLLLLPCSLRRAVKMTAFHHLLVWTPAAAAALRAAWLVLRPWLQRKDAIISVFRQACQADVISRLWLFIS